MKFHRIESHLKDITSEYPEYENLYATWCLNKETCTKALKNVLLNYPHYSMHDANHSETIITKIEMLLGDRVSELSPTDMWLILNAAYSHDLGMLLDYEKVKEEWAKPEFRKHLAKLSESYDNDLSEAAKAVLNIKDYANENEFPVEMWHYVSQINASYFRDRHASMSKSYICDCESITSLDLGHNGMIKPRLINLLGSICELHSRESDDVLLLPYETDGFGTDHAHPRFVAMLLRIGDLLDIDNGRFNIVSEAVAGSMPESSISHRVKHESTTHLLVTPSEIQFCSDCPDQKSYLLTRDFITWLEKEIDFMTKHWVIIVPEDFSGHAPRFDKKELLIRGGPDVNGTAGLKFEITQKKAFEIIEGSNIYEDKFVFIREVIQNAIDASKIQLWRDLQSGTYNAWINVNDLSNLQPYDLPKEVYENYAISVRLFTSESGEIEISVTDRGTGITDESFKEMCNVGVSNSTSSLADEIESMPCWLRPTAGFGVGLQSIFLMTDHFKIETCTGSDSYEATVYSMFRGGYLNLISVPNSMQRGTTIKITVRLPENFSYSAFGMTNKYISDRFDYFDSENRIGEMKILDTILDNCKSPMFPVVIKLSGSDDPIHINPADIVSIDKSESKKYYSVDNRYYICQSEDLNTMKIWDKDYAVQAVISLTVSPAIYSTDVKFKGISVSRHSSAPSYHAVSISIDLYGLEAKKTIALNRSSLTDDGKKKVNRICDELVQLFTRETFKRLGASVHPGFRSYSFWTVCSPEQRLRISQKIIDGISGSADILKKNKAGKFEQTKEKISDIIAHIDNYAFLTPHYLLSVDHSLDTALEKTIETLNTLTVNESSIVIDNYLTSSALQFRIKSFKGFNNSSVFIYTVAKDTLTDKSTLFIPDEETELLLINGLNSKMPLLNVRAFNNSNAKRYAIPAFEEYRELSVKYVPLGVSVNYINDAVPYIISPFTKEQADKASKISEDTFINEMTASAAFDKLVRYVCENSFFNESPSVEIVKNKYIRLAKRFYSCMKTDIGDAEQRQEE